MALTFSENNLGTYQGQTSYVLDGDKTNVWRANNKAASGSYVLITSDELMHITTVVYTTTQTDEVYGSETYLQISTDGSNYKDIGAFSGSATQTFTVNADAKYVRLYSKSSGGYVSISELEINYSTETYTITVKADDGIDVDKKTTEVSGGEYVLTINPTVPIVTMTDNGVNVLSALQEHTAVADGTITSNPTAYETSGSISGTRYKNCIGKGSSTTATGNDYASGNSSAKATITCSFDFSSLPENAIIDSVSVKVGGHAENTSRSTATLQLYSGSTAKGSESKFTSTSKQVVTMTPGTWTRAELQNAKLVFTIGYYGGLINGVDFEVAYHTPSSGGKYYTYTISNVKEDHTIIISASAGEKTTALRVRVNGSQKKVVKILKKVGGVYVQVDEAELNRSANYHLE